MTNFKLLSAWALVGAAFSAQAHDTWFEFMPATEQGEQVLALGTGNQFPKQEVQVRVDRVKAAGCGDTAGRSVALRWMADRNTHVLLRTTRPVPAGTALSCLARMATEEITITDNAIVDVYLDEIRASDALRNRWATMRSQGLKWQETYHKLARIMASGNLASGDTSQGLDARMENPQAVLRKGDKLRVQILRDGQPLAGQMIEFRNDLSAIGFWRRSDEQGWIELTLPLAARWLIRGVDLRPAANAADRWESYFLSLAFEVVGTKP